MRCPLAVMVMGLVSVTSAMPGAQVVSSGPGGIGGGSFSISTGVPTTSNPLPEGSGAISGVITDATTGRPLVGAIVSLSVASRASIGRNTRETTDTKGRFVFTKLPARDDYQLSASMPGYFGASYGQTSLRAESTRLVLTEGQWLSTANIALWKGGAITGTVVDERGEPVVGVYVHVLSEAPVSGLKQLASGPAALTDDRGIYRIAGLGPRTYLVSVPTASATVPAGAPSFLGPATPFAVFDPDASSRVAIGRYPIPPPPEGGRRFAYPPAYAPDATSVTRATPITLAFGESRTGVDVRLDATPASAVSGRVEGLTDPIPGLTLRLLPAGLENLGTGSETATAMVGTDGSFVFLNVPAGTYSIDLRASMTEYDYGLGGVQRLPLYAGVNSYGTTGVNVDAAPPGVGVTITSVGSGHDLWGRTAVTVGGADVTGVVVAVRSGSRITGHFTVEQKQAPGANGRQPFIRARAEPANASAASGSYVLQSAAGPAPDPKAFELTGIPPGQYVLRFTYTTTPPAMVKSILVNGEDYTYRALDLGDGRDLANIEVTFTDQLPTLEGTVHNSDQAIKGSAVIAFPVEGEQWTNYGLTPMRIRTATVSSQETFRVTTLPEGDYYVIAVPSADRDGWMDPEFLKQAARVAVRVSLKWGQTAALDLPISRVR